jgi:hypothetical protein
MSSVPTTWRLAIIGSGVALVGLFVSGVAAVFYCRRHSSNGGYNRNGNRRFFGMGPSSIPANDPDENAEALTDEELYLDDDDA